MKTKLLLAVAAAWPLAACNMVISEKPWFTEASGPQLKDGLWANLQSADCKLDPASPIDAWPECASPVLVKGNTYSGPPSGRAAASEEARRDPAKWEPMEHVLVDGSPQIDQLLLVLKEGNGLKLEGGREQLPIYIYLAVRPIARDSEGQIVEVQRWPVLCGPMPEKPNGKNFASAFNSDKPFKGIKVEKDVCVAESAEALRDAAAVSEAITVKSATGKVTSRWVRAAVN